MKQHKIYYGSSYDRGLDMLLFMWPEILEEFPHAQLHICYGWDLFNKAAFNNPERMKWKEGVDKLMTQPGIYHHGRVGKKQLQEIRSQCGIWAYPTYFTEINCITALEAQRDGLVPVVINLAALKETVGAGVKVEGLISDKKVVREYTEKLLNVMRNESLWKVESKKAKKFARKYDWGNIATQWTSVFNRDHTLPLVSVVTLTIREGWWNVMAENLSKQSYKNFEWVILDDHKQNREATAKKYAEKYGLNIRYIRGDKVLGKYDRRYGLVRGNNKAWRESKGELLVWLQDFILIPQTGIERMVDIYRKHPHDLIAPTDIYYLAKPANQKNVEDWWDGDVDIITNEDWRNIRNDFQGMRVSDNAFDFEMNWAGTPKSVLEELGGWWEFFDNGLGYDNTEIAYRALRQKRKIWVDDLNVAECINIWPEVGGTEQNIKDRERYLATPYWLWFKEKTDRGNLPIVRNPMIDSSIDLKFEVPNEVDDKDCASWINAHAKDIVAQWNSV